MRHLNFIILTLAGIFLFSCKHDAIPLRVKDALEQAKSNSVELQKTIDHYSVHSEDSLKLKAAYFLISNMGKHSYYQAKIVDSSGNNVAFNVLDYPDYTTMVRAWDSVEKKIGSIDFAKDTIIYDIRSITAKFLIENIDLAFEAWQKPWARFLSFDEFCNYLLPYRSSNEPLEYWRRAFVERYHWIIDSIKDRKNTMEAAFLINNEIKSWYAFDPLFYRHPTDLGYQEMLELKRGRCEDMTNLAIYAMRAQGIPVVSDYTPAWPNTGNNHAWNAILTPSRELVIFMGGLQNPGEYKLNNKKAKVYRKMFATQKDALASIKPSYEKVPGWLRSKTYIDVTQEYIAAVSPNVELSNPAPDSVHFAYLCVFNSGEWKAIHWGKIKNGEAQFSDMGSDIVYLPAYYKKQKLIAANDAFILDSTGKCHYLQADTSHQINIKLYSTTRRAIVKTTDEIRESAFKNGKEYELFYWDKEWKKLGSQIAKEKNPLQFSAPSNALLWLVEKDSKKEERIFTIEAKGEQHWW